LSVQVSMFGFLIARSRDGIVKTRYAHCYTGCIHMSIVNRQMRKFLNIIIS